jgi:hypothetical protein
MAEDWHRIDRGLYESPDGQWRIANPWKLRTELRHRWLVAERRSSGSAGACTTATTRRSTTRAPTSPA